jgi:hypothetical protein
MERVTEQDVANANETVRQLTDQLRHAEDMLQRSEDRLRTLRIWSTRYTLLLRFRRVGAEFSLWPLAVMLVLPFSIAAFCFLLGALASLHAVIIVVAATWGGIVGLVLASVLLFIPPTEDIRRQLPGLQRDLARSTADREQWSAQRVHLSQRLVQAQRAQTQTQEDYARSQRAYSVSSQREELFRRDWRQMRGDQFRRFLEDVFRALGAMVETSELAGDQGVDLIVRRDDRRLAVHAQGCEQDVGNQAVQEVFAGMAYYQCDACVVVTNRHFTAAAQELARRVGCRLIDEDTMHQFVMGRLDI